MQCCTREAVVHLGVAVVVEAAVLGVEVGDAQRAAVDQDLAPGFENAPGVGNVVQGHRRVNDVVALCRLRVGEEVDAQRLHVGDAGGGDLAAQDLEHAGGGVGEGDRAEGVAQGEAQEAGAAAELETMHRRREVGVAAHAGGDRVGALDVHRIGVPVTGFVVETHAQPRAKKKSWHHKPISRGEVLPGAARGRFVAFGALRARLPMRPSVLPSIQSRIQLL